MYFCMYMARFCRNCSEPPSSSSLSTTSAFFFVFVTQDVLSVGGPLLSEKLALHLFRTFFRPVVLEGLVDGSESMMAAGAGVEGAMVMEEREPEVRR